MSDQQTYGSAGDPGATRRMPRSGPPIAAGSRVVIRVSKGAGGPQGGYVTVPELVGVSQGDALKQMQDLGLTVEVLNDYSDTVNRGHVAGTLPHAGQSAPAGTEAVLLISNGASPNPPAQTALPIVAGLTEAQAVSALEGNGLSPHVLREFSPNVPEGIVIDQLPSAASLAEKPAKKSSLLWLWILIGVLVLAGLGFFAYTALSGKTTPVPNVIQMSQADAEAALTAAGLKVGTIDTTQTPSAADVGKVVAESPAPGTSVKAGSPVNITVSGGQTVVAVPSVTGLTQAAAQSALTAAGLTFKVINAASTAVPKGNVISQAPAAGQQVTPGTSIGLTVSTGPGNATVPSLVGQTQSDAQTALNAAGLGVKIVSNYNAATAGQVYSQSPAAGTLVAPATVVTISVSKGPQAKVTVPDVIGESKSAATTSLKDLGFLVDASQVSTYTVVSSQNPAGGSSATKGSTVKIVIGANP